MKIGIISSVVATILFIYLLDPLLRLITFLLFNVFSSVAQAYTDRLFAQAALLSGPDPSFALLSFLAGISSGILSSFAFTLLFFWNRPEPPKKRQLLTRSQRWLLRWGGAAISLLLVGAMILMVFSTMFQLRITTSFTQHLATVAPYITDQDAKVLKSRWTRMRSESDFRALYHDLNQIAEKNELTLPENKVYSFSSL
ncbi:MAG: hypothetical protein Q8P28_08110 [Deltaproteobacteria bacterium]|nr:hypothetical protein [Deltaproteobacteria bacterium]